jgi:hypothetical protein
MLLMALHAMHHVPAIVEACKHHHHKGIYFCPNIPWKPSSIIGDIMKGIPVFMSHS